jgi:MarR family transcriptional regulator, transcriptional regulator for hemolysin
MDLLFLLNQASFALGNEMATRLAEVGITPRHYCVLSNALRADLTQIRLAERSMLDKTTMVVTLDELERMSFVVRRPSKQDRRVKLIAVTPEGKEVVARAGAIVEQMQRDLLDSLPPESREAFVESLEQLVGGPLASPSHVERVQRRPRERSLVPH